MENNNSSLTHSTHQKQTFWQVWCPLVFGILVILFMAVMAAMTGWSGSDEGGRLAGISTIFLLVPILIICFFLVVIFGSLIFVTYKLTVYLPIYSLKALTYVVLASDVIHLWADRIVQPVIIIREGLASLNRILDTFSPNPKK